MRINVLGGLVLSSFLLLGCGAEEESDTEETTTAESPPAEAEAEGAEGASDEGSGEAGDVVARDESGEVRVGPNGEVQAEEADTGETATVTTEDGTTNVDGADGENVNTNAEGDTTAQEGGDNVRVGRRGTVVASDGDDTVVIDPNGRGVTVGGIRLGN